MPSPAAEPLHPTARGLTAPAGGLQSYPPLERWDDWEELDPQAWPRRVPRRYRLIPTICFNCEAACGLLTYVDRETHRIQKFEGNPEHPGSRGRNCAKGPATLNQVEDPERIRYPLKRVGPRGGGQWQRVSWNEALDDLAATHPQGAPGGPAERGHVPRRPPGARARVPPADPPRVGDRRPQLAHQRVLRLGPGRLRLLERARPALARSRERALHPPPLLASRDGPLLQPPRAADHRGQEARRQGVRHRHSPQQHGVDG